MIILCECCKCSHGNIKCDTKFLVLIYNNTEYSVLIIQTDE